MVMAGGCYPQMRVSIWIKGGNNEEMGKENTEDVKDVLKTG